LDLRLTKKDAAKRLGVHPGGLENWEFGRTVPAIRFLPAIIRFLEYNPIPEPDSQGRAIMRERISRGWSRKCLALEARVDEGTVKRLETDTPHIARAARVRVMAALALGR